MPESELTPMLRQYRELKQRHPDALLFYRLGDFYELFEQDARTAARALGLALTTRRFSKKVHLPMCGVPYRTVTTYVARLLGSGYKVAIAEQMEDARRTKGLVRRDVVRIITPGTVVEEELLNWGEQSLLVAVVVGDKQALLAADAERGVEPTPFGLALVDLSTGEFAATQGAGWPVLVEEMQRLRPREIVLPATRAEDEGWAGPLCVAAGGAPVASGGPNAVRVSPVPDVEVEVETARRRLDAHLTAADPGLDGAPLAVAAAGAALAYLQHNQVSDLAHLHTLALYDLAHYVALDATTRRNLELTSTLWGAGPRGGSPPRGGTCDTSIEGSLCGVLDHTETAMGARLLRRWVHQPLLDVAAIEARLDAVQELVSPQHLPPARSQAAAWLRADLRRALDGLHDVERLVGRAGFGTANARDLVALGRSLARIPRIKALLSIVSSGRLRALNNSLDDLSDVAGMIDAALVERPPILIREGGLIRPGYDAGLDALHTSAGDGRDWLAQFEADERRRLDIPNLRVRYNQVFGFFVEVTRSHLSKVPPEYERRASVRGAERFVTPTLQARQAEILAAEDRAHDLEYELFVRLRGQVAGQAPRLLAAARVLAELDVLASLAEVAARHGYSRPRVDDSSLIDIREGRHPVVEQMLPAGELFVANDTRLDHDQRLAIITGPNMAGKSVLVRQVALIVLLAQMGSFVPAAAAHIGLADRIFARVGASDDIAHGRSTFLVEMSETAHILAQATTRSLVILDEVGRGTSTYDGMSLAWAVAADLHDRVGARCLFATHYHELTELPDYLLAARNYNLAVVEREGEVVFLRRLVPGGADRSYGLHVARLAGVPPDVVDHAAQVMARFRESKPRQAVDEPTPAAVREAAAPRIVSPGDETPGQQIARELRALDIANLTPVQALVALNEWQMRLRGVE